MEPLTGVMRAEEPVVPAERITDYPERIMLTCVQCGSHFAALADLPHGEILKATRAMGHGRDCKGAPDAD